MRRSIILGALGVLGCGGPTRSDGLEPAGDPEILQVFARERTDEGLEARLAHGDHPDIDAEVDDREVDAAVARDGQRIRVVFDELLRGNDLEEIPCADGTWSRIPVGADFDDVAACAGADLSGCSGICIGDDGPVGILDDNGDGAIDDTRLIADAVVLTCDDVVVPLDPQASYYQPSGSQLLAAAGTDTLGPAVAIVSADGMPPGSTCGIAFAPSVVDKDGNPIGDAAAIRFTVEDFALVASDPPDGALDVELTAPDSVDATIAIQLNATLDADSVTDAVTVTAGGEEVEDLDASVSGDNAATVIVTVPGGFAATTDYAVTVTGVRDIHGNVLDAATITWTTKGTP